MAHKKRPTRAAAAVLPVVLSGLLGLVLPVALNGCSADPLVVPVVVELPVLPQPIAELVELSGYRIDWYDRFRGPRSTFAQRDAGAVELHLAPTAVGAILVTPLADEAGLQLPAAGVVLGARRSRGPFASHRLEPRFVDGLASTVLLRVERALGEGATVNAARVVEAFREAAEACECVDVERVATDAVAGRLLSSSFSPLPSYDTAEVTAGEAPGAALMTGLTPLGFDGLLCPGLNQFLGPEARLDVYIAPDGDIRILEIPRR